MLDEITIGQTEEEKRAVRIADAQAMLDFIKEHPELPFPKHGASIYNWYYLGGDKDEFLAAVRSLGSFEKTIIDSGNKLRVTKAFGESKIYFEIPRSVVCRKVRVMKEVDDYECDPLLSPEEEQLLEPEADSVV